MINCGRFILDQRPRIFIYFLSDPTDPMKYPANCIEQYLILIYVCLLFYTPYVSLVGDVIGGHGKMGTDEETARYSCERGWEGEELLLIMHACSAVQGR